MLVHQPISTTPLDWIKAARDQLVATLDVEVKCLADAIATEAACRQRVSEIELKLQEFNAWLEVNDKP